MRIALLSDTHVPIGLSDLPGALLERLEGVDRILHAGDLVRLSVVDRLATIATTTAVAGNMDPPEVRATLRDRETIVLAGRTVGLAHGHQPHAMQSRYIGCNYDDEAFDVFYETMAAQLPEAEIIVFGHFHRPVVKRWRGILFVNPGAIAPPHPRATYAILDLGEDIDVRIVDV